MAVKDGKIAFVGLLPPEAQAQEVLDAQGHYVTPGFIDAHSHADVTVFGNPESHNKAGQGITTDISGHCGTSNAPKDPASLRHEEEKLGRLAGSMSYLSSYGKTIAQLESMKLGVNMAQYVGHGSIRAIVCQGENQNRPLTKKELDHMEGLLKEAMEEGAMGVSFGLIYPPGSYADLDELVAAAKVAARYDRSFSVHMRSESLRLVESVEDMIEVARRANCRALLSHHKAKGRVNWDKTTLTLPLIERANREGLEVELDQYPYTASATYLGVYIPQKFQAQGRAHTLELLRDKNARQEIRKAMEQVNPLEESNFQNAGFAGTLISRSPNHPEVEGLTVAELAEKWGKDPFDAAFDLLLEDNFDTDGIYFMMSEKDVIRVLQYRRTMVGTDGGGVLPGQITHPRIVGSFPQILGRYVRDLGVLEVEEDANVYDTGTVVIVEIMGRNAGWLTAASALASHMGGGPDLIYLPEQPFDLEAAMAQIKEVYDKRNNCLVALSEGIMDKNGKFIAEYGQDVATDAFGHKQMGGAGAFVANEVKSRFGYKVRSIELSLLQRCAAHSASLTDIEEAYQAGKTAVELAVSGVTDKMVAFERKEGAEYQLEMKPVPLDIVANTEKKMPTEWIKPDHTGLTDDFIAYALPLIQGETQLPYENGLPRFARLKKVLAK